MKKITVLVWLVSLLVRVNAQTCKIVEIPVINQGAIQVTVKDSLKYENAFYTFDIEVLKKKETSGIYYDQSEMINDAILLKKGYNRSDCYLSGLSAGLYNLKITRHSDSDKLILDTIVKLKYISE